MRWLILVVGLVVMGGCADRNADLRTQAEGERQFMGGLFDSLENWNSRRPFTEGPFGP